MPDRKKWRGSSLGNKPPPVASLYLAVSIPLTEVGTLGSVAVAVPDRSGWKCKAQGMAHSRP